jgi:hypothetical protein
MFVGNIKIREIFRVKVKLSLCLIKPLAIKAYGGVEV